MSGGLVVDTSVAIKWLIDEPDHAWARTLPKLGLPMIAPDLMLSEASNALWKIQRRGLLAGGEPLVMLDRLVAADLEIVACAPAIHRQALALATRLDHPAYDCLYLALALSRGAALATADARFARVLRRDGALPEARLLIPPEPASPA